MLGDADGVLCVPFEHAERILVAARAKAAAEVKTLQDIAAGQLDMGWIDDALRRLGCDPQPA